MKDTKRQITFGRESIKETAVFLSMVYLFTGKRLLLDGEFKLSLIFFAANFEQRDTGFFFVKQIHKLKFI